MPDENLTIRASAEGTEETARKLGDVADAEKRLTDQVEAAGKGAEKTAGAQKKVKASTEDWVSILSRVHPALGATADAMVKGSRIAGELATRNIKLGGTIKWVTSAVKKNAAALALIGAGGAVVAALSLIAAAVSKMKEDFDAATAAIKRQRDALNELKSEEQGRKQAIEDVSDTRRGGGYDEETSRRVGQTDTDLRRKYPNLDEAALIQTLGMMGETDLSREELARAAFLESIDKLKLDERMSADQMRSRFNEQAERFRPNIVRFFGREDTQGQAGLRPGGERLAAAKQEVVTEGGSTLNIEGVIRQLYPGISDEDVTELLEELRRFPTSGALERSRSRKTRAPTKWELMGAGFGAAPVREEPSGGFGSVIEGRLVRVLEALERREGGATTIINQQNSRFIGPSADVQRRARRNGEAAASAAERF